MINQSTSLLLLLLSIVIIYLVSPPARADAIVGFEATIVGIPEFREDGTTLDRSEIKSFRVLKMGDSGLEALTPDIVYNQEDEVKGMVFTSVSEQSGSLDLCAMTINIFDQISTVCSNVVAGPFAVAPPGSPGSIQIEQAVTLNVTVGG